MSLSYEEEVPLLEKESRDEIRLDVRYQSLLKSNNGKRFMSSRQQKSTIDPEAGCSKNEMDLWECTNELRTGGQCIGLISNKRIVYSWRNINVYASPRHGKSIPVWKRISNKMKRREFLSGEPRHILKNVYGLAQPGELLGVMGSSGAGKTTLLNTLTFHSGQDNLVEGFRCLNGYFVDNGDVINRISAYVEQDNLFLGTLTVREHLIFQSLIRMDRHISYRQRIKRVEEVIKELGLEKCKNTSIGVPGRSKGISGGEMKRLAFASEVLTNPPLMFCDEPTSGLDSFIASNVISVLKTMANSGKTVVCTIHQPSSEIFRLFDRILLLAEGRTAFLGTPNEAVSFMTELGAAPLTNYNPADFFIQLLAVVPKQQETCRDTIEFICDSFDQSSYGLNLVTNIECGSQNQKFLLMMLQNSIIKAKFMICSFMTAEDVNAKTYLLFTTLNQILQFCLQPHFENDSFAGIFRVVPETGGGKCFMDSLTEYKELYPYKATWFSQFGALLWRSWLTIIKEPLLIKVRLFQTVILSLMVGLIYNGQKLNEDGVMNINGVLFTFLTNMTFQNLFAVISVFCSELPIFFKEHSNKMYRVDVYFLSKCLAEIPLFLAIPIIFTSITYYWIGLAPGLYHFAITVLVLILVNNVAVSFGYFVSCLSKNVIMALSVGPPIIIPFLLFGGFLLNSGAIPPYVQWLSYLSWFKYGNEALLINQWSEVDTIKCNHSNTTCPKSGEIVLDIYNFNKENLWWDLLSLLILVFLFRSLAFFALMIRTLR